MQSLMQRRAIQVQKNMKQLEKRKSLERAEIIQSYIVTTARYNFSVYEKRILYRIIEMMQHLLQGKKLNQHYRIDKTLFDIHHVEMPLSAFLTDEEDDNYARAKEALQSMSRKFFQFELDGLWREIPLILLPKILRYEGIAKFRLHENVFDALLNFSKGFQKYELKTAFEFESTYAMRFYELFSRQRSTLVYSIQNLKLMFGVENKYTLTSDFIKRVIVPAKKELDKKSPYSFEYTPLKTGRQITAIKFFPYEIPENRDEDFEGEKLRKQVWPSWTIERIYLTYLKEHYMFSMPEIQNNKEVFERAQKEIPDLLLFLSELKTKANRAGNPKGYVVNALRKKMGMGRGGKNSPQVF